MFLQVAAIYSGLNFQSISGNVELTQILYRTWARYIIFSTRRG